LWASGWGGKWEEWVGVLSIVGFCARGLKSRGREVLLLSGTDGTSFSFDDVTSMANLNLIF
jgi:hypothetical protein